MSISRCFAENVLTFPMKNRHITPLKRPWNLGAKRTTFLFRKAQRCAFCWRCSAPLWRSRSVKRGRGRRGAHLSLSLSLSQKACMFVSVCVSPSLCARVFFFVLLAALLHGGIQPHCRTWIPKPTIAPRIHWNRRPAARQWNACWLKVSTLGKIKTTSKATQTRGTMKDQVPRTFMGSR